MKTIDNFIEDKVIFEDIKKTILGKEFTWKYSDEVGSPLDNSGILFCHQMYFSHEGQKSDFFRLMHPIIGRLKFNEIFSSLSEGIYIICSYSLICIYIY